MRCEILELRFITEDFKGFKKLSALGSKFLCKYKVKIRLAF
jgi:hypothetical protein